MREESLRNMKVEDLFGSVVRYQMAALCRGLICHSHYDGVRN